MTPATFVESLSAVQLRNVFNPYSDRCSAHDLPDGPAIRRNNLKQLVFAAEATGVEAIWVGRDLGYRGGRRTGLALTDEANLDRLSNAFDVQLKQATVGEPVRERTAAMIWRALDEVQRPIFMWNAFPLHPHDPGEPFTNRCHTRNERALVRELFVELLGLLRPRHVLAIGRDAAAALREMDVECLAVRHPSYGGQSEFFEGVARLYSIPTSRFATRTQPLL